MCGVAFLVLASHAALSIPVWAAGEVAPGLPNFHQVNARIYRGGQPKSEGWDTLAKLGVKTVIDLRAEGGHSARAEERAVAAAGMHYVNVPLSGMWAPPDATMAKVLALLDESTELVFVHCRRGADRTGTVMACYRIAHDGWSNRKALQEAGSYGMRWVNVVMRRYILAFHPGGAQPASPSTQPQPSTLN
jgi:protein tyrosine phosphatase (PTP) superfamily phosphohydrolase (DUF442 family)